MDEFLFLPINRGKRGPHVIHLNFRRGFQIKVISVYIVELEIVLRKFALLIFLDLLVGPLSGIIIDKLPNNSKVHQLYHQTITF